MNMEEICKSMPKVELHAHLNGCISDETLLKISGEAGAETIRGSRGSAIAEKTIRSLSECFTVFKVIHEVIRTPEILYMVTCEVIRDFCKDNVVYLELRTTPKRIHDISSKDEYVESVIKAIIDCQNRESIIVKLLLSIDRKMGPVDGAENIELAERFSKKYPDLIVGMDLSGDPTKGSCDWILPLLERARKLGLRITAHLPEVIQLEETEKLLSFHPERVGHGLFLHPSQGGTAELWETTKKLQIPVEVCISSNLISGVTEALEKHHVILLHAHKMPYVICTDDSGVFSTSLTKEFQEFLKIVPISRQELKDVCLRSVDHSFATAKEKIQIRDVILRWWTENESVLKLNT